MHAPAQGGYEVEVLWVWNGPVKEWEAKLPEGTRETIEEDRKSESLRLLCLGGSCLCWLGGRGS